MAYLHSTSPSVICTTCGRIADDITPTGPTGRLHCTCMTCGTSWTATGAC